MRLVPAPCAVARVCGREELLFEVPVYVGVADGSGRGCRAEQTSGKTLGISMSELMGRPFITGPMQKRSASLERFAASHRIPDSDIEMLASIRFRGDPPQTEERWEFIYNAIKASVSMDPPRRRG